MSKIFDYDFAGAKITVYNNCALYEHPEIDDCYPVLLLQGTAYEKGFAYGKLMTERITKMVSRLCTFFYAQYGGWIPDGKSTPTKEQIYEGKKPIVLQTYRDLVPAMIKETKFWEELKGLYDGLKDNNSSVDFDDLLVINTSPESYARTQGCSNFAVWDSSSKDGSLYHGVNLDYGTLADLPKNMTAIVEKNDEGHSYLAVTYIGCMFPASFVNAGKISYGELTASTILSAWPQLPHYWQAKKIAVEAGSVEDAHEIMKKTGGTTGFMNLVAQANGKNYAAVIEAAADLVGIRRPVKDYPDTIYDTNYMTGYPGLEGYEGPNLVKPQIEYFNTQKAALKRICNRDSISWGDVDTVEKWRSILNCERYASYDKQIKESYGQIDLRKAIEIQSTDPLCFRGEKQYEKILHAPEFEQLYGIRSEIRHRNTMRSLYTCVFKPENGDMWLANGKEPAQDGDFYRVNLYECLMLLSAL
ncbi:MAG: C45 family autoproteolytic acyltransferase/hydrolase [Chloroflexi bacterium]|nr:C45 family autoproteolytic acyltransferase/hydrolase [Chloroflexota bacterium]